MYDKGHKHKYSRLSSLEHGRILSSYGLSSVGIFFSLYDMYVKVPMVMPVIKKWISLWFFTTREGFVAIFVARMTTLVLIGAMVVLCYPNSETPFANNFHLSKDN